jgi:hypothetical protein
VTGIARQLGYGPGEHTVDGPTMGGAWIALDDIPGDLPGGVYEIDNATGDLRELPAEPSPAAQRQETEMSTQYHSITTGRPVAPVVELSSQPGAVGYGAPVPEPDDSHRGFGPRPSSEPASTYRYVESGDPFDRWYHLQNAANDPHLQALAKRSNTYSRDYAQRLDSSATDHSYVPRWQNGQPINGRDGRPLWEDDGAAAGGNKIGPTDGRRAAAETWIAEQRRIGNIR